MKEIILLKLGEMVLKGLNRKTFDDTLIKNIKKSLADVGSFDIKYSQSTVSIAPLDEDADFELVCDRVSKIFGIATFSRACVVEKDFEKIAQTGCEYLEEQLSNAKTFKVNAKRSDKHFPMGSPEICMEMGGYILDRFPNLSVDVHNPEVIVTVEVRDVCAYVRGSVVKGAGGMPVGTGGKAGLLISGGIDSPVAGYMMAKRGVTLYPIHFTTPPYTSERAEEKVIDLLKKVSLYSGSMEMQIVSLTKIQEEMIKKCPEEYFTIILRRFMMKTASILAKKKKCLSLITGESLGQVASQTMAALGCTNASATLPVFRPLIGMDKEEIVEISRKIDTFETSILPFEDCCTVFTPKHPKTRPILEDIIKAEAELDVDGLIQEAIKDVRFVKITS